MFNLERFIKAQDHCDSYLTALNEIREGYKRTHWMWYVFPQAKGLGHSEFSNYYGIGSLLEAKAYLENETLSSRLREAILSMVAHAGSLKAEEVLGHTDAKKLRSSLTLFDMVQPDDIFNECLIYLFEGRRCVRTLEMFSGEMSNYKPCDKGSAGPVY